MVFILCSTARVACNLYEAYQASHSHDDDYEDDDEYDHNDDDDDDDVGTAAVHCDGVHPLQHQASHSRASQA